MTQYPIRHVLVRHEQGATHMADGFARATGTGRGRDRDVRSWRDQHGHGHCHRDARLVAHRLHHRTGRQQADRLRCVSGDRHHGRHAAHHEAQLPGHARGGRGAGDSRGVPRGGVRQTRDPSSSTSRRTPSRRRRSSTGTRPRRSCGGIVPTTGPRRPTTNAPRRSFARRSARSFSRDAASCSRGRAPSSASSPSAPSHRWR